MKSSLSLFILLYFSVLSNAQTSQELYGKWQLVKWVKNGKEKDIQKHFKTDQVYQVFNDDKTFESLIGTETHKGKWHFSNDNTELTLVTALLPVTFKLDYFDKAKRVMTYKDLGTFTYNKVKEPLKIEE